MYPDGENFSLWNNTKNSTENGNGGLEDMKPRKNIPRGAPVRKYIDSNYIDKKKNRYSI